MRENKEFHYLPPVEQNKFNEPNLNGVSLFDNSDEGVRTVTWGGEFQKLGSKIPNYTIVTQNIYLQNFILIQFKVSLN